MIRPGTSSTYFGAPNSCSASRLAGSLVLFTPPACKGAKSSTASNALGPPRAAASEMRAALSTITVRRRDWANAASPSPGGYFISRFCSRPRQFGVPYAQGRGSFPFNGLLITCRTPRPPAGPAMPHLRGRYAVEQVHLLGTLACSASIAGGRTGNRMVMGLSPILVLRGSGCARMRHIR